MTRKSSVDQEQKETNLIDVLKIVSPGTVLRNAIDDILRAEMGSLIVVNSPDLEKLMEGGFNVNCDLTSQRIVELAKMDGAIILSADLHKILAANVLLVPDTRIPSIETGTRHKAAERTAQEASTLIIAISERRKKVTLYHSDLRYVLQNPEELLSRATETLQILEKQREIFGELLSNLNVLEISGLVVVNDVCSVLQRIEIIMRTARMMDRYLIELGREGVIIRMRVRELLKNINREKDFILRDYVLNSEKEKILEDLNFDELLDIEGVCSLLFGLPSEEKLEAKGYRILNKIEITSGEIEALISNLKNLSSILNASLEQLANILQGRQNDFQKEISSLREQIMMARKI